MDVTKQRYALCYTLCRRKEHTGPQLGMKGRSVQGSPPPGGGG